MKALHLFSAFTLGIALVLMSTTSANAQGKKSSDLLPAKQVKELAATAKTPADHMKLSKHYAALAEKYDAEAVEHDIVAKAYRAMPNASESKRPGAPDTAIHCDRLAAYARDAAKEARMLAAAHEEMASGRTVQSERPGDEELIALIDHATSPSQHEALAAYYDEVAKDFDREVVKDRDIASRYRNRPAPVFPKITPPVSFATHYDGLAMKAWRAAKEAMLLAEHHRMLAKAAALVDGSAAQR
jgi:hypothetical protein